MATFESGIDPSYLDQLSQDFLTSNPLAAFYRYFPKAGGSDAYGNFLRNKYGSYYNTYMGQLPENPNMSFGSFLGQQDPSKEFRNLAPTLRGERPDLYQPKVRYTTGF